MTTTEPRISKWVHPWDAAINGRTVPVFVEIHYRDGRLSLSGVEGPNHHGSCLGSCGQLDTAQPREQAQPWADRLAEIWDRWHLNDMRAGCAHQRNTDLRRKVEVVTYRLTHEAQRLRNATREAAASASLKGEPPRDVGSHRYAQCT